MWLPRHGGDSGRSDDECGRKREDGRNDELRGTEKHEAKNDHDEERQRTQDVDFALRALRRDEGVERRSAQVYSVVVPRKVNQPREPRGCFAVRSGGNVRRKEDASIRSAFGHHGFKVGDEIGQQIERVVGFREKSDPRKVAPLRRTPYAVRFALLKKSARLRREKSVAVRPVVFEHRLRIDRHVEPESGAALFGARLVGAQHANRAGGSLRDFGKRASARSGERVEVCRDAR